MLKIPIITLQIYLIAVGPRFAIGLEGYCYLLWSTHSVHSRMDKEPKKENTQTTEDLSCMIISSVLYHKT